jgi:hypothetical protein
MGHHELRQGDALDENDPGGYAVGVGDGLVVKLLVVMKTPRLACAPCMAPANP